jgi:hypothetical protein
MYFASVASRYFKSRLSVCTCYNVTHLLQLLEAGMRGWTGHRCHVESGGVQTSHGVGWGTNAVSGWHGGELQAHEKDARTGRLDVSTTFFLSKCPSVS